ncbi:MAG TPA: PAS domain-containing sensor histidine kinase [Bacteroidetes bacterium]|nr:sporulation kinase E [bacterium BMS3Bbin04]HDO65223.1 PAS domain-containing sensor histidine kinase [Bacteroidota bacterium]HEX04348.1 PAS domain-containing sensor histidine kinase [Bacteroidota bacterium]
MSAASNSDAILNQFMKDSLFDALPMGAALVGSDKRIRAVNKQFEEVFGVFKGRLCYHALKQTQRECATCEADLCLAEKQMLVADHVLVDRHGRDIDASLFYQPVSLTGSGDPDHVLMLISKLTETRKWKREFDRLFEHVPCYISILDKDLNIVHANGKLEHTFGRAEGASCYKVYKGRNSPCTDCPAMQTFSDGLEHSSTQEGVTHDGKLAKYFVNVSPLSWGSDGVEKVIEISTDITELSRLEKEALDNERLVAVGQTVAGLAHTIKNLLMGLEGGMYMVDSGLKKGDEARLERGWDMLQRNFEKTTAMVRDFLSFSKGRVPSLIQIDPAKIIADVVELYHDAAGQQGVELLSGDEPAPELAPLDPEGIEACLTNLLSNGIDAASVREGGGGQVTMSTFDREGELIFEVRDNGIGMEADVKRRVFTTFFTTKGNRGTGLGLLTTRKIVQEHHGVIEVDTERGVGSVFRIRLPRQELVKVEEEQKIRNEKALQYR